MTTPLEYTRLRYSDSDDIESFFEQLNLPAPEIHENEGDADRSAFSDENSPVMDVIIESGTQMGIQDQLRDITDTMRIVPNELQTADKHMGNSATFLQYERLASVSCLPQQLQWPTLEGHT